MRYRKLRIAWSVAWGVACVLLFALWMRSLWLSEYWFAFGPTQYFISVESFTGTARLIYGPVMEPHEPTSWTYGSKAPLPYRGFELYSLQKLTGMSAPTGFWHC